jgi:hypothetical protein
MMTRRGRIVLRRTITAPPDCERVALISVAMPAGACIDIDPLWRFEGWVENRQRVAHQRTLLTALRPEPVISHATEEV